MRAKLVNKGRRPRKLLNKKKGKQIVRKVNKKPKLIGRKKKSISRVIKRGTTILKSFKHMNQKRRIIKTPDQLP